MRRHAPYLGEGCVAIPVKDKSNIHLIQALEEIERTAKNSTHSRWQRDLIHIEHLARDARHATVARDVMKRRRNALRELASKPLPAALTGERAEEK